MKFKPAYKGSLKLKRTLKSPLFEQLPFITRSNYMFYSLNGENITVHYRQWRQAWFYFLLIFIMLYRITVVIKWVGICWARKSYATKIWYHLVRFSKINNFSHTKNSYLVKHFKDVRSRLVDRQNYNFSFVCNIR